MKLALVRGSIRFLLAQAFFPGAVYPRQTIPNWVTPELADDADAPLDEDRQILRDIVTGFNRLEEQFADPALSLAAKSRGYFTPDEDDRLRQMLLAYPIWIRHRSDQSENHD